LLATFRCTQIINDADANALQETMMKAVAGSFDPKSDEQKLSLEAVYDLFYSILKVNLAHPTPVAEGPNFQQRQLQATLVGNVFPDLVSQIAVEKRRESVEAEALKKMRTEIDKLVREQVNQRTRALEAEIRSLKSRKPSPSHKDDRPVKKKKSDDEKTCLLWMEGKCQGKYC
ncbi:unnamed protein product, partial [Amoebophrya sp. A25]